MAGGHLGGHLSYAKGVGVDQTTFERRPDDWRPALADAALGEGQQRAVDVEGVQVAPRARRRPRPWRTAAATEAALSTAARSPTVV